MVNMTGTNGSIKLKENKDCDVEYIMQVDRQFADHIDDIVKSLELSHFTVATEK